MNRRGDEIEIVLVEDNPADLELAIRALTRAGLGNRIQVARDGEEALEFLLPVDGSRVSPHPKVVLLDLKLPKVDGFEVLHRLKTNPRTLTIPVVVLTSSSEPGDLIRSYELGANSYIVKPVDFEGFARAIEQTGHYWLRLNQRPA
jgi:CheY-like chemotaxis protein